MSGSLPFSNPTGRPAMLRKAFEEGAFHVIISEPLLEEITDVLNRPKDKEQDGIRPALLRAGTGRGYAMLP